MFLGHASRTQFIQLNRPSEETGMVLRLSFPWSLHQQRQPVSFVPQCALSKQGHRLLTSLDAASGDTTTSHRLIRKFIASSSKSVALNALSHLLSSDVHRHSALALPMYERIKQTSWFNWNPKLVSNVIASLTKQGCTEEADILISQSIHTLGSREKDITLFYCDLIDSFANNGCKESVFDYCTRLKQLIISGSASKRKAFESMIKAFCLLDSPNEAEEIMKEMKIAGMKPSGFEFRSTVLAYGRLGLFTNMARVLDQMEDLGYDLDTICYNVVLSSYGTHGQISNMVSWIQKMKNSSTPFSIRTYNTVINSCPTITSLLQDTKMLPLSIEELMEKLEKNEGLLIRELVDSSVLVKMLEWSSVEGKLDLHGMHLGCVYVIMLQWIEELRMRLCGEDAMVPADIVVVCGLGKHSSVRGESPVKGLLAEMMVRLESPMRVERKNIGCFVAKGKNVKNWLC